MVGTANEADYFQLDVIPPELLRGLLKGLLGGGYYVLLGASFSGKTTLLNLLEHSLVKSGVVAGDLWRIGVRPYRSLSDGVCDVRRQLKGLGQVRDVSEASGGMLGLRSAMLQAIDSSRGVVVILVDDLDRCEPEIARRLLACVLDVRGMRPGAVGLIVTGALSVFDLATDGNSPFILASRWPPPTPSAQQLFDGAKRWLEQHGITVDEQLAPVFARLGGNDIDILARLVMEIGERAASGAQIAEDVVEEAARYLIQYSDLSELRLAESRRVLRRHPKLWVRLAELQSHGRVVGGSQVVDIDLMTLIPGVCRAGGEYFVNGEINRAVLASIFPESGASPARLGSIVEEYMGKVVGMRPKGVLARIEDSRGVLRHVLLRKGAFEWRPRRGERFLIVVRGGRGWAEAKVECLVPTYPSMAEYRKRLQRYQEEEEDEDEI